MRAALLAAVVLSAGLTAAADDKVVFNRDVRPILSNNCFLCHGPDAKHREAGLRLDDPNVAVSKLESGATAIVPGDPAASELLKRITAHDPDVKMPPRDSGKSLTPEQIATLTKWIAQGADYQGHWSFLPPQRPTPPTVNDLTTVRNEIDLFLQSRLEREGLPVNGEADKVTLLRRLTLDLTGLPPTIAEVDAFLSDDSPEAYERAVDRLLDSPRFGEHFGRIWLDAARYGDTHGLHLDNERSLWPYRDWVINAFNQNLPFDQFTIQQLAGDLLPNATRDQQIASGFNRCNVTTSEGGSINEEVLVRYAIDRTEAMATVWMGLTLGCAVCHDHKFDPVSQREFYSLYAFFNSLADAAMDGNALLPPPILKLPTEEHLAQFAEFDRQIAATQQEIRQQLDGIAYVDSAIAGEPADALSTLRREVVWIEDDLPSGANAQGNTPWEFVTKDQGPVYAGERASKRTAPELSQHFFTGAKDGLKIGDGDVLFAYVYLDPANPPQSIMLQFNDGAWEHRMFWGEDKIPFGTTGTPSKLHGGPLPPAGQWIRLEVAADQVNLKPGATLNGWAFTQYGGTVYWDHAGIVTREHAPPPIRSLLAWEEVERSRNPSSLPGHIQNLLKVEEAKRNADQQKQLRDYFLQFAHADYRSLFDPLNQRVDSLNKQKTELDQRVPATMVSADLPQPREAFVLTRGAYDKPGEKVDRGVPAIFPPLPEAAPKNRLGLAQWLVSPEHPLTARVIVNRYWQHYFGTGIVKTAEDFGAQGEWPAHPELLDWLATEFVRTGWDVKRMQKLIVMSAAYRRSSKVRPDQLQRDPDNRLLARGPRFRLDAEVIRDTALAISGLLMERPGGKSVKPYQPDGVWEAVAFVGSNTRDFKRDDAQGLYRRSLYTFWKRTSPPPSMLTFDAPSRETCTVRRPRTNTPLQSLALMNDTQYVEAARRLAERMLTEGGSQPADRLEYGFRLTTARRPTPTELEILRTVFEKQLARFTQDAAAAEKLLAVGEAPRNTTLPAAEHAAYTMTANLLLNLDEAITKE
uniref:DUF1553 domain-containing protein n=1 Tax=Schlesneria paludicola TaxID=360056 RepID=A0A7C2JYE2_9PLAN